jgi:hypothetical protein
MRNRKKPSAEEIIAIYDAIEELDHDISTERLFAMVRDHFRGAIDYGDISAALRRRARPSD